MGSERPTVDAKALYLMCLQAQVYPYLSLPPHLIAGKVKVLLTSLDFTPPKGRISSLPPYSSESMQSMIIRQFLIRPALPVLNVPWGF